MSGVRITSLTYVLDLLEHLSYKSETRLSVKLDGFDGELTPTACKFVPTEIFETVEAARARLDPQLEAWRRWTVLQGSEDWLPFRYERAESEPWPPGTGNRTVMIQAGLAICFGLSPTLSATHSQFPPLGPPFQVDECVEIGYDLLADSKALPKHALMCSYAFLSLLEQVHGGHVKQGKRKLVAAALNLDDKTLGDFGRLTSEGGEGAVARKHGSMRLEFTERRREWLLNVFRVLIQRQGQFAAQAVPADLYVNRMP